MQRRGTWLARQTMSGRGRVAVRAVLLALILATLFLLHRGTLLAALSPDVRLGAGAQPMAEVGGSLRYGLEVTNWGFGQANQLLVTQTLPAGFSYQTGSTRVNLSGELISLEDPDVQGQDLTWGPFALPGAAGTFDNHYGVHTFVQDLCLESYVDFQLDKALNLVGVGGHVTQLLYPVTASTMGPDPCWVHFVEAAYDRTLVPIVRLQGEWGGDFWIKPEADSPGNYTSIAQAFERVVEGLPRRDGHTLYVQVWNEPDVSLEWGGEVNASEYGHFFVDVTQAIHSIGDPRIKVLNGALTPGNAAFVRQLTNVPGFVWSFDLWASHCYPFNHPPSYNIHNHTARYPQYSIDSYLLELSALANYGGRRRVKVLVTETGYQLYDRTFRFEGYPTITEDNRASYIKRAFRDYWASWPEVVGVTPFELVDPYGSWWSWDWLFPGTDVPHKQYTVVRGVPKPEPVEVEPSELAIIFAARTPDLPGTYYSDVAATANKTSITPLVGVAPVVVVEELHRDHFPLGSRGGGRTFASPEPEAVAEISPAVADLLQELEPQLSELEPVQLGRTKYLESPGAPLQAMPILARIDVGAGPQALALDPSRDRAYVTLDEGLLITVDTQSLQVLCAVSIDRGPQGIAVVPSTGSLFVASGGDGTVLEVEGTGCGEVSTIARLGRPAGLVVDELRNRIYVSDSEAGQLVALDLASHQIAAQIPVGSHPEFLAIDQTAGLLYVGNAGDGTLSVIESDGLQVVRSVTLAQGPLLGVAAGEVYGRAYVVHLGPPPGRQISVVDGGSGEVAVTLAGDRERHLSDVYSVAVDEERERLYVVDRRELLVVGTDDWALIGATPVDATAYNSGLAVDPVSGSVYLLDSVGGELIVLAY
jgi:uncharacterized repeat protein (TIGR01451 family)